MKTLCTKPGASVRALAAGLLLAASLPTGLLAQNVGVNTNAPATRLDVNGDLALRRGPDLALPSGPTNNLATGAFSLVRLTGAAAATVTGLVAGPNGKWLTLVNATGQPLTLAHESTASDVANRLRTPSGTDLTLPAGAAASLVYNDGDGRWQVTGGGGGAGWSLAGNAGTNPATQFVGTTDAQPLVFRVNNAERARLTSNGGLVLGNNANQNLYVGFQAGEANTSGSSNYFVGYQAGAINTTGSNNHFEGFKAGNRNTTGGNNFFAGYNAGTVNETGSNNLFVGTFAGEANTVGNSNVFAGFGAGGANTSGIDNNFVGFEAGRDNVSGSKNTLAGHSAGNTNTIGSNNVAVGYLAGNLNTTGDNNTFVGYQAGPTLPALSNATAIGFNAKVARSRAIVLGGIDLDAVNVGIGFRDPLYALHVNGTVAGTAPFQTLSDARYKRDVATLNGALEQVLRLRGVRYRFRTDEFPALRFDARPQLGFIAQELTTVLPEAVSQDANGYYSVAYTQVIPLLVEAIRELKAENDALKATHATWQRTAADTQAQQRTLDARLRHLEALLDTKAAK